MVSAGLGKPGSPGSPSGPSAQLIALNSASREQVRRATACAKMTLTNASHTRTIEKTDPLIFKPRAAGCRFPTFCQAYSQCRTRFLLPSSVGTSVVIKQSMIPCQVLQILKPVLSNWAKNPKHATVPQYQMSGQTGFQPLLHIRFLIISHIFSVH